jgi:hypothetical protein
MSQIDARSHRHFGLQESDEDRPRSRRGMSYQLAGRGTKSLHRESRDLGDKDFVQMNWGRVQQNGSRLYTGYFIALCKSERKSRTKISTTSKPTYEQFQGFVERIEEGVAYITLMSSRGERLCGPYPVDELVAKGIGERDRFWLRLTDAGDSVRFDIQLIPRKTVSAERQRQIRQEIEQSLDGYTPDDDY